MVHDVGEIDGHTILAMGFIEGVELRTNIKERPLKPDEALDIATRLNERSPLPFPHGLVANVSENWLTE